MTLGLGASCRLTYEDGDYLIYKYSPYDYNYENWKDAKNAYDGIIRVHKDYFPKPIISKKKIKKPNGKKVWIERRKYPEENYEDFIQNGKISIINSLYAKHFSNNGIDRLAIDLIYKMNLYYQKSGQIPEKIDFFH